MPKMIFKSWQLLKESDALHLHLPQFDAFYLAAFAKIQKIPLVVTYQCDLDLPKGFINRIANSVMKSTSKIALFFADIVVTTSLDYAEQSELLKAVMDKVKPCLTPIESEKITHQQKQDFLEKFNLTTSQPIIGMAGRLATEKGMEIMANAFQNILAKYPDTLFIHAGNSENVLGEEKYRDLIFSKVDKFGSQWKFLGELSNAELTAFYQTCDILAFPSLNSTEAFGMVQVEAMIQGTPVVASDLPGSRQPVKITGMGKIVPVKDAYALAKALIEVLNNPEQFKKDTKKIAQRFSSETAADFYEKQFQDLINAK